MTTPAEDFTEVLSSLNNVPTATSIATVEPAAPGPRTPAPNRAQGSGGARVMSTEEIGQRLLVNALTSMASPRGEGGWTDLTTRSPY
ncbi:hypothetical protein ACXR2U_04815 [Jatrophihabitans sp. YIM 134969]